MSRWRTLLIWSAMLMAVLSARDVARGDDGRRFFYEGDGQISLVGQKTHHQYTGAYRQASGGYDQTAYKAICKVFGAPFNASKTGLSLRLIAFLDFLEDRLGPGSRITITSGYRDPVYNRRLRQDGRLAAKASLHQYGMAADIIMAGVSSERIWHYVKSLRFGGTGYYHGETVHLDVGPARSWDETTSGVGTGLADDNKLIGLVTDFDRYGPGDMMNLRFIRMTAFPIGVVPEFTLKRVAGQGGAKEDMRFIPDLTVSKQGPCLFFNDIGQMAFMQWRLPEQLASGRYVIVARFCDKFWEKMPAQVETSVFEVISK